MANFVPDVPTPGEEGRPSKRSLESGPRILAKVVERVIARLEDRLSASRQCPESAALASTVNKTWRETYGRLLPTAKEAQKEHDKDRGHKRLVRETMLKRRKLQRAAREQLARPPSPISTAFGAPPLCMLPSNSLPKPEQGHPVVREVAKSGGRKRRLVMSKKRPRPDGGRAAAESDASATSNRGNGESGKGGDDTRLGDNEADVTSAQQGAASESEALPSDEMPRTRAPDETAGDATEESGDATEEPGAALGVADGAETVRDAAAVSAVDGLIEGDMDPKNFDFIVTATHIGDRRRSRGTGGWWRFELEAGVVEGAGEVFAFDRCHCLLDKPQL